MTQPSRLHLFQAFGIELEYMIVDRDTLQVRPIADELLKKALGHYGGDFDNGLITWSNELVLHVIELKSSQPEFNLNGLAHGFADNVTKVNGMLEEWNAMLMPTATHPLMDPLTETRLWPHDSNEVYTIYNKIFNCNGHGWSNLQSTHLNLPFYDDEEFTKLHAAIRCVLPLLPALCASSPLLDGRRSEWLDTRLHYYKQNQSSIPSITGKVVPEAVFSRRQYYNQIYERIREDIAPYNADNILDPIWVNSRGAIPRFDRGSIEIRIMDIQECPQADLAVQNLVIETIRALVNEKFCNLEEQMKARTEVLAGILDDTARTGQQTEILSTEFPALFGMTAPCTMGQLWRHIVEELNRQVSSVREWNQEIETILAEGTLSDRILRSMNQEINPGTITTTYRKLGHCLAQNKMFF